MFRRYWLVILALGLILAVAPSPSDARDAMQSSGPEEAPKTSTDILDEQTKIDQAKEYQAPCLKDERNYQSDLCAQWKAADAAQQSADAADQSVFIGWVGTILGAITMGAAIFAAKFAKEAADHTKSSNNIAVQQARAYLKAYRFEIVRKTTDGELDLFLHVKNDGQCLAEIVEIGREYRELLAPDPIWLPKLAPSHLPKPIKIGGESSTRIKMDGFVEGSFLIGYVEYNTLTLLGLRSYFSFNICKTNNSENPFFAEIFVSRGQPDDN